MPARHQRKQPSATPSSPSSPSNVNTALKYHLNQTLLCICEDGEYNVTITKVRPNSSKPYKIRFTDYGKKYDSWCIEDNLSALEERKNGTVNGRTASGGKKQPQQSKKRKRTSQSSSLEFDEEVEDEEEIEEEEEDFHIEVGKDYLVRLQEGDFPVRVLQFKKNTTSRVKIHYYGYGTAEDNWVNVKFLFPLPAKMAQEIPNLVAEEQDGPSAAETQKNSKKGKKNTTQSQDNAVTVVTVKRKVRRSSSGSTAPSTEEAKSSSAHHQEDDTTSALTAQETPVQSRKKRKLNSAEGEYIPPPAEVDNPEALEDEDDTYMDDQEEEGIDEDDDFRPELEEEQPNSSTSLKRENGKEMHRTPRTTASKSVKAIKEEVSGANSVTDEELATPSKDSNSTSTTPSMADKMKLSPRIAIPDHDTWQKRVTRAIRVMDRDYVAPIACRQEEIQEIEDHISQCMERGRGTCIYLSGKPGTGKTQTIFEILNGRKCRMVYVDCMSSQADNISQRLIEGTDVKEATPESIPPRTVLILDEVEHFLSSDRTKHYVEELMHWTTIESCPLIIIGIANKLDFRELPLSDVSRTYTKKSVIFKPYTDTELEEIVNSRLRLVNAMDLFAPRAIKFLCWKIATAKGDARTAIDITQKAVQHVRDHHKENETFTLAHFNQLLPKWLPSNSTATKLESLTQQQKLILMVILRTQKTFATETALTMDKIKKECRRIRRFTINLAEMNGAIGALAQQGLVSMKKTRAGKEEIQILVDRNMVINYFENSQSDMFLRVMRD